MTITSSPQHQDIRLSAPAPVAEPARRDRKRARRGEGDRLREEILAAAEHLLVEHANPDAVSIRSITDRVGCTAPSLYRHFADKDALLVEVCERAFERFDEYISSRMPADANALDELEACANAYVHFAMDHPGHYRVLFMTPAIEDFEPVGEASNFHVDYHLNEATTLGRLIVSVQQAMDAGFVHGASAISVASLLWAGVHGLVSLRIAKPHFPWPPLEDHINQLITMMTFGMCSGNAQAAAAR
jgi:AcrR family transcriptional regulator